MTISTEMGQLRERVKRDLKQKRERRMDNRVRSRIIERGDDVRLEKVLPGGQREAGGERVRQVW